jgi:Glycosyltransferase family 87
VRRYRTLLGVGVTASVVSALLGYAEKLPCSSGGAWNSFTGQFADACYTDIYPLYYAEGLNSGQVPYADHPVEYPVLIGGMMQLAATMVRSVTNPATRGRDFYYVTVVLLSVCLVAGVLATAAAAGRNGDRWGPLDAGQRAALMVALSPALILTAFINWDLLAMALTAGGVAAWAARREALAGMLLGFGVAAKFYPLIIFGALLLLCLRAGRLREFGKALAAGAFAWLAVNLPIAIAAPAGWGHFFAFSQSRGADWGAIWFVFEYFNLPGLGNSSIGQLNLMSTACIAVAALAIAVLALTAPRRPRLPQLCFLLLAAFLMLNKVWSPQYVIWLVPFAVLARPRIWAYVVWQLTEVGYFFAIWAYFVYLYPAPGDTGIGPGLYFAALIARFLAVALLAAIVVHDILHPERDRVRAVGHHDDPAGGVLDGAPDRWVLRLPHRFPVAAPTYPGLGGELLAEPADVGGDSGLRRLADRWRAGRPHHVEQRRRVDRARVEVRVPVGAGPELVARVVAVHQVDPAGDRLDLVHHVG